MKKERLLSLDLLRGFDLFMLVCLQPVLYTVLCQFPDVAIVDFLLRQIDHEVWEGFRVWDIVMPLFLFMAGVAMPFSFSAMKEQPRAVVFRRILRRVIILWLLGMVVQGNLLSLHFSDYKFYSNTLQAIAMGYLFASMALLFLSTRGQMGFLVFLVLAYYIPLALYDDYSPDGNLAYLIDEWVLGSHRDDKSYTWILSSFGFGSTVMLGVMSGHIIRLNRDKMFVLSRLLILGLYLVISGWLLSFQMPIIKRIWTTSMMLFSGGICVLLLAIFYYVTDIRGRRRHILWLRYFGMNSITAYMLGEWLNFRDIVHQFTFGLEPYCGNCYYALLTLGQATIVFLILRAMFLCGKFVKV